MEEWLEVELGVKGVIYLGLIGGVSFLLFVLSFRVSY